MTDEQTIAYLQKRFGHLEDQILDDIIEAFQNRNDPEFYYILDINADWEGETEHYHYDSDKDRWGWVMLSNVIELRDGKLCLGIKHRWERDDEDYSEDEEDWIDLADPNAQELEKQRDIRLMNEQAENEKRYIQWVAKTGKHPLSCAFMLPDHLNWRDHSQREAVKQWVRENKLKD